MKENKSFEIKINGMDCADCALHVKKALNDIPTVTFAEVFLGAEKAIVYYGAEKPAEENIKQAVKNAGYEALFEIPVASEAQASYQIRSFGKNSLLLFIAIVISVLGITLIGEQFGFVSRLEEIIPWYIWFAAIILFSFPILKQVFHALRKKRIISHTLMTASMVTAVFVGEWATALLIVVFMRLGEFIERNTTEKARQAIRKLKQTAPHSAHVIIDGKQHDVPISHLKNDDIVLVKPGESIPVDGIVLDGKAVVDQSAITGESMPSDKAPGHLIHAASIILSGSLRIKTTAIGKDSLFGRIITLVEEAEGNRGQVQGIADKFSSIYLPIVALIALLTYIIGGNAIAAAAVMAVSCSCSFSLATPVAMLASIGTAAQQGLLFKGGKYIEELELIDTIFIDKTGTLTLGKPAITETYTIDGFDAHAVLQYAASAEQYSEHPLAAAILHSVQEEDLSILQAEQFTSEIGQGVTAIVDGILVEVLNKPLEILRECEKIVDRMKKEGKTILFVHLDGQLAAILGAEDVLRPDTRKTMRYLKELGFHSITLISGDHTAAVKQIADKLKISFQAGLLPQEKIGLVKEAQKNGKRVMMIGDGINDAPALAQADIGIAMGASGTDIAIETAPIVLLREDWNLVPEAFRIAKRTMRVVRFNIFLTAIYNLAGISLAAFGLLAPAVAAAMQSIPDVGIMANSARLLKKKSIE